MPAILIRTATLSDLPEMTRLWHEKRVIQQQFDRCFMLLPDGASRWSSAAEKWLQDNDCAIFIAVRDTSLLGYIVGWVKPAPPGLAPEQVGVVTDIAVDAHSHEGGVGKSLYLSLREWFVSRSINCLLTNVPARQTVEQAFWRSQGAVECVDLMWIRL